MSAIYIIRALYIIAAVAISAILAATILGVYTATHPIGAAHYADALHQCEQSETFTCGPAAAVSALSYYGAKYSERDMCAAFHVHKAGCNAVDIRDGLNALGYNAWMRTGAYDTLPRNGLDVLILRVANADGADHWICAVYNSDLRAWYVNDPAAQRAALWSDAKLSFVFEGVAVDVKGKQ